MDIGIYFSIYLNHYENKVYFLTYNRVSRHAIKQRMLILLSRNISKFNCNILCVFQV